MNQIQTSYSGSSARRWSDRQVESNGRPLQVLVVDDNENAAEAMAMLLSLKGLSARTAFNGRQGLSMATDWLPDVVLLDISMPDVDGFAVAAMLRQNPQTENIVILAFTAHDESVVSRRASKLEFDGYLQKGAAIESLVELLSQVII